jgi:hypothetical protein
MWNLVSGNKAQLALAEFIGIAGNKVALTKVQYLPRYREEKLLNLLLHNDTVRVTSSKLLRQGVSNILVVG